MKKKQKFGPIRKQAFKLWKECSGRSGRGFNESIAGTYECNWQVKADDLYSKHVSIFCSLGEWAGNITDILKDKSLDELNLFNSRHRQTLYRYFTRLLLVISEMLVDFQDIYIEANSGANGKKARKYYSSDSDEKDVNNLFSFINNVCKHKTRNIHTCNHHLNIWFEDTGVQTTRINQIRIGNLNFSATTNPTIVIPSLIHVVSVIIHCYIKLNQLFEEDESKFDAICQKYKKL